MAHHSTCIICNKIFLAKWHGRDKVCSESCRSKRISQSKQKYTKEQIEEVIRLKKESMHNSMIVEKTGVKLSKIKEIVKEHNLFLSKEAAASNAYNAKIAKNPKSMEKMRSVYGKSVRSEDSLEKTKQVLLSRGYEYVEGFKTKTSPFKIKCLKCQKDRIVNRLYNVVENSCSNCSNTGMSKPEEEIRSWIESLGLETTKYKFPNRAGGREIDIFIPSLMIGIEYCGLYWHNENSPTPRGKTYHYNKMVKANSEGIRLITIFEDEWTNQKVQIKNFLKSVLGIVENRIFARKCEIRLVEKYISTEFLKQNHIQESAPHKVSIGIYWEDELVGLVTGNNHHRKFDTKTLILNRLVFKDGYQVVGGSSRLIKNLVKWAILEEYKEIVSWSDNRWSEGNVYKKTGFELVGILDPDYSYVVSSGYRESKQSNTKKILLQKGAIGNTETEMATSLGYNRIWDCGKKTWRINLQR